MQNSRESFSGKGIKKHEDPEAGEEVVCLQSSNGPEKLEEKKQSGEWKELR